MEKMSNAFKISQQSGYLSNSRRVEWYDSTIQSHEKQTDDERVIVDTCEDIRDECRV